MSHVTVRGYRCFTGELVERKAIRLNHISTKLMIADILTKALGGEDHRRLGNLILGWDVTTLWMVCETMVVWPCVPIQIAKYLNVRLLGVLVLCLGLFDDGCPTLQGFDWRWLPNPSCTYDLVQLCIYCIYCSRILLMVITGAIWDWEWIWVCVTMVSLTHIYYLSDLLFTMNGL